MLVLFSFLARLVVSFWSFLGNFGYIADSIHDR